MEPCVQSDPDIELMLQVKHGDEAAFAELAQRYRRRLAGFFYSLCWNYETAQDYTQEVILRLWLARDRYEPTAGFATYIFRIARNYWVTVLRYRKCRPESISLDDVWQPHIDEIDVEHLLIRRYEDQKIREAISDLPEHYRLVFILSHFQELRYIEIAEILEIPIGTVKSRMSSAVRLLREIISE
jgi:RNA polymerase sigma-70 factor (ECF subfamily)